jgi:hypothetical protein
VKQLTSLPGNFHHLYFTSSSFTAGDTHVLYIGDHGSGPNLFKLSLADGSAVQLTDNRNGIMRSYVYYDGKDNVGLAKASPSYNAATNRLLYIQDDEIRLLHVDTLEETSLGKLPGKVMTGFTHLSADGTIAAVPIIAEDAFQVGSGNPFGQIREKVAREYLSSRMLLINVEDASTKELFTQPGWITHVQFHPENDGALLYNHEGGLVEQRIWLYAEGVIRKVREQSAGENALWICHEMWTQSGKGIIYHGTYGIPNDPAMAELSRPQSEIASFVGHYELETDEFREILFPSGMQAYGHFTSNSTDEVLVTDGVIDDRSIHLVTPDWRNGTASWTKLCTHGSSFGVQDVHPHPIFSNDDRYVLFTSDAHNEKLKGHLYIVDATDATNKGGD